MGGEEEDEGNGEKAPEACPQRAKLGVRAKTCNLGPQDPQLRSPCPAAAAHTDPPGRREAAGGSRAAGVIGFQAQ